MASVRSEQRFALGNKGQRDIQTTCPQRGVSSPRGGEEQVPLALALSPLLLEHLLTDRVLEAI